MTKEHTKRLNRENGRQIGEEVAVLYIMAEAVQIEKGKAELNAEVLSAY